MKVSDYITQFLVDKGIRECFGYPGGSVTNLLDSIHKWEDAIRAHVTYHEQGAAFAACGYAATSGRVGMAYATGGPGCTNLLTGMGHAFCDSIPVLYLTGNVNTYENKGKRGIRQRGFQESDNVAAARPFTKFAAYVEVPEKISYYLEKAYYVALHGRRGPVLLDLPMDIQRAQVDQEDLHHFKAQEEYKHSAVVENASKCFEETLKEELECAQRPCLIFGNGIYGEECKRIAKALVGKWDVPYVTSMVAFDVIGDHPNYYGFLGAYGDRAANFVAAKSDLLISIGSRLDIRQVGVQRENFAPDAKIIRIDIDPEELKYKVHDDEAGFCMEAQEALNIMCKLEFTKSYSHWKHICNRIRQELQGIDYNLPNIYMSNISEMFPENAVITTDVGQNQVWVAQSLKLKKGQKVLFSGGFGAMGHALPSAIGAFYGSESKSVVCICGDGGFQMNIQELQYIVREKLPIKIIVFNNNALGMIRHFQEMYFDSVFYQTKPEGGYVAPDFVAIGKAYGIRSMAIDDIDDIGQCAGMLTDSEAALIEIRHFDNTYIIPKLEFGKPNQDQEPLIDRTLFHRLMALE